MLRLILVVLCVGSVATAQVKVTLPKTHFRFQEVIPAEIENHGRHAIVFCVQYGQWSTNGNAIKSTPLPFVIEKESANQWSALVIGPDLGANRRPLKLDAGKSLEFPFRLSDPGTLRLRLEYWKSESANGDCASGTKGKKNAWSKTFLQD